MHCHEHALFKPEAEAKVLKRIGVESETMPTGCCGMAGSFGFEAEKYPWSVKIAAHALLPRLDRAPPEATVIASGFSCREQIEQFDRAQDPPPRRDHGRGDGRPAAAAPAPPSLGRQLAIAGGMVAAGFVLGALTSRVAGYRVDSNARRKELALATGSRAVTLPAPGAGQVRHAGPGARTLNIEGRVIRLGRPVAKDALLVWINRLI